MACVLSRAGWSQGQRKQRLVGTSAALPGDRVSGSASLSFSEASEAVLSLGCGEGRVALPRRGGGPVCNPAGGRTFVAFTSSSKAWANAPTERDRTQPAAEWGSRAREDHVRPRDSRIHRDSPSARSRASPTPRPMAAKRPLSAGGGARRARADAERAGSRDEAMSEKAWNTPRPRSAAAPPASWRRTACAYRSLAGPSPMRE